MNSGGWLRHTLRDVDRRPQRQALALGVLALFVGIIIGVLYLSQSASASTLGRQLEALIDERNALEQANEQLRAEIASWQTVDRLQRRAAELGFVLAGTENIEYLVVDGYDPERNQVVAPIVAATPSLPVYDESFAGWVQQQIDALSIQLESFTTQEDS